MAVRALHSCLEMWLVIEEDSGSQRVNTLPGDCLARCGVACKFLDVGFILPDRNVAGHTCPGWRQRDISASRGILVATRALQTEANMEFVAERYRLLRRWMRRDVCRNRIGQLRSGLPRVVRVVTRRRCPPRRSGRCALAVSLTRGQINSEDHAANNPEPAFH
jgi:hypothetical protein